MHHWPYLRMSFMVGQYCAFLLAAAALVEYGLKICMETPALMSNLWTHHEMVLWYGLARGNIMVMNKKHLLQISLVVAI